MSGLVKSKKYNWKDSNMALFGSDVEKQVKKESAESEKAWQDLVQLKDSLGTLIWKIEKFQVVPVSKDEYGNFYNGDSYIVFHQKPQQDNPLALDMDIHFWIGEQSTPDEYGTAAYKTVELDTYLDDKPIQHREVQGKESLLFKSYFDHITILKGGADSGFRKVVPIEYVPRLFKVFKKERKLHVVEVMFNRENVKSDDVFILDDGLTLYQFNGRDSSFDERFKAAQYLQGLISQRNGKPIKETFDEDDIDDNHRFYELLNEKRVDNEDSDPDETDSASFEKVLFKLSDETGKLQFDEFKRGTIKLEDFCSSKPRRVAQDVFILDTGIEMFVWIGGGASVREKLNAFGYAHKYLQKTQHPFIPVTVINEGQACDAFRDALC